MRQREQDWESLSSSTRGHGANAHLRQWGHIHTSLHTLLASVPDALWTSMLKFPNAEKEMVPLSAFDRTVLFS